MADPSVDGRGQTARGRQRRELLVEAAGALITTEGFAGVSHRMLAKRTGLPLAATTYYFSSLDEIIEQAVDRLARNWLTHAEAALERLPDTLPSPAELAEAAVTVALGLTRPPRAAGSREQTVEVSTGDEPTGLLTMYERYIEAGRRARLRTLVRRYDVALDGLLVRVLARGPGVANRPTARLLLAQIDGAVLRALAERDDPVAAARYSARTLLELLLRPGD